MSSIGTSALFRPLKVGSITVHNRLQMSALTRNRAPNTVPSELMKEYYVQRAKGGAGIIVSEGILIVRQGTQWENAPGIWNEEQVQGWKKITDAVHAQGSAIYAQLWHLGRASHPDAPQQKLSGNPVYAPSAIAIRGGKFRFLEGAPGHAVPTAVEDPQIIIDQFKVAAENAKAAGFDGVELHCANGYLVPQFLETESNIRTDKWGGSIENRARFGLETLKALKRVFGENVAVKVSPAGGYNDMGMPLEDALATYRYFISEADKLGLAYITLMRYLAQYDIKIDDKLRATQHDILELYRPSIKNAKVFLNGDVKAEEGAALIESGKIDGVTNGFLWVTHPDVGLRLENGKPLINAPDFPRMQIGFGEPSEWDKGYTDYPAAEI